VTASISGVTITGGSTGYAPGAGLYTLGTTSLTNCTISGNSGFASLASGSYSNPGGSLTLTNCTVSGNSAGGLFTYFGPSTLTNTIVAGNTNFDVIGTLDPASTNNLTSGDPLLAPLDNYGGTALTMPLLPGSPALDAGTSGAGIPASDQRGSSRFGAVDIGAFESQGFNFALVPNNTPHTANIPTAFAN